MNFLYSLKAKLLFFSILISLLLACTVSAGIYIQLRSNMEKELQQRAANDLSIISNTVEMRMDTFYKLVYFCSQNLEIRNFLNNSPYTSSYTAYPPSISAHKQLDSRISNTNLEPYLNKLIVSSQDGRALVAGTDYGSFDDVARCAKLPYFEQLLNSPSYLWLGLYREPFAMSESPLSLPMVRPLKDPYTQQKLGWIYLSLNPSIISDQLTSSALKSNFFWIINGTVYQYTGAGFSGTDYTFRKQSDGDPQLVEITANEQVQRGVLATSPNTGWQFVEIIPKAGSLLTPRNLAFLLLPCLFLLALSSTLLTFTLRVLISRPIEHICNHLRRLSRGELFIEPTLEGQDEFGYIGHNINQMAQKLGQLMNMRIQTEQEKRKLELENLQAQISPHFLFNTLLSIRMMAVMQNVPSIAAMLNALSEICKNISKNTDSTLPLRDELALLEHYILIQRYRYGDSFAYSARIDDEALLDVPIFKFSLQPIIENAISYGVGTAHVQKGQITLHAYRKEERLVIEIMDNGKGISADDIAKILSPKPGNDASGFKKIGLSNINRRLILEYGESYALKIDSVVPCYTKITISYPLRNTKAP